MNSSHKRSKMTGLGASILLVAACCFSFGCAHIGPKQIIEHRLPYQDALAESWKQQMLLNLVKIRYGDVYSFTNIAQIINGHEKRRSGGIDAGFVPGASSGLNTFDAFRALFRLGAVDSNRPTITYSPQTGSDYVKQLCKAIPPSTILYLIESGYPADLVLRLTVESINGVQNRSSSGTLSSAADPQFEWMASVFRRAQVSRSVSMRLKLDEAKKTTTVLRIRPPNIERNVELEKDLRQVRQLLRLDLDLNEYQVLLGTVQVDNNELVMQTRPILRILAGLAQQVQVPEKHLQDGSARPVESDVTDTALLTVRCGDCPPEGAFAAVPYRGCWYWIEDSDLNSKRTFTYLLLLMAQAEQDPETQLPLVTIPAS